jgi:hypothetical protein
VLRTPKEEQKIQNLEVEPWIEGSKVPAHLEVEPCRSTRSKDLEEQIISLIASFFTLN